MIIAKIPSFSLQSDLVKLRQLEFCKNSSQWLHLVRLQVGGRLTDFIIVLYDSKAVQTFRQRMHFSLGAGFGAAAGPLGRVMEIDLQVGTEGSGMCYAYSCSKGTCIKKSTCFD